MCGRFVGYRNLEELRQHFPIDVADCEVAASYNVAPTQQVLAIVRRDNLNVLDRFHWGLVPFWARETAIGHKMINARSETIASKPSFRNAFIKRRCLIPADGFFEWKTIKGKKQPVFVTLPDETPFAFAGLWETWQNRKEPEAPYRSCTIITREAEGAVREIHHRMPVIVSPAAYQTWLAPENRDTTHLRDIITRQAITDLVFRPVSTQVNNPRTNQPSNIRHVQTEFDF